MVLVFAQNIWELNMFFFNVEDKFDQLVELQNQIDKHIVDTAYLKDDLKDLPFIPVVPLFCSINKSNKEVKKKPHLVLNSKGGDGAVREFCDMLLKSGSRNNFFYQSDRWNKAN